VFHRLQLFSLLSYAADHDHTFVSVVVAYDLCPRLSARQDIYSCAVCCAGAGAQDVSTKDRPQAQKQAQDRLGPSTATGMQACSSHLAETSSRKQWSAQEAGQQDEESESRSESEESDDDLVGPAKAAMKLMAARAKGTDVSSSDEEETDGGDDSGEEGVILDLAVMRISSYAEVYAAQKVLA
jgi:hypothetical protein